jgi:hypothetical protein
MALSDLASLGSFVSGVAVLVSLVFLYFQLRQLSAQVLQTEKYQQTLVKQARTSRVMEVNARLTDPGFAELNLRVMTNAKNLTLAEWSRFNAHARAVFQNGEDTYSQYRRGLLHVDDFQGFVRALSWTFRGPALRVAWRLHRESFPPPYVAFVDEIVAASPVTIPRREALVSWKAAMAAELATVNEASTMVESTAP